MPRHPTRLTTAIHEAGHVIVQLAGGSHPWVDFLAIDGLPDGLLGRVETVSLWQPVNLRLAADREVHEAWAAAARRDVVTYLAGPVAELRWRRHSRAAIWFGADQMATRCLGEAHEDFSDFGRVRRRLECALTGDEHKNFVELWLETEEQVNRWWREIVSLGRTLAERGRIEDVELYAIWNRMRDDRESRTRVGINVRDAVRTESERAATAARAWTDQERRHRAEGVERVAEPTIRTDDPN